MAQSGGRGGDSAELMYRAMFARNHHPAGGCKRVLGCYSRAGNGFFCSGLGFCAGGHLDVDMIVRCGFRWKSGESLRRFGLALDRLWENRPWFRFLGFWDFGIFFGLLGKLSAGVRLPGGRRSLCNTMLKVVDSGREEPLAMGVDETVLRGVRL